MKKKDRAEEQTKIQVYIFGERQGGEMCSFRHSGQRGLSEAMELSKDTGFPGGRHGLCSVQGKELCQYREWKEGCWTGRQ